MDEVRLSAHERRVLAEIEETLNQDEALDRRPQPLRRALLPLGVALALAAAATLIVPAAATGRPGLVWAFAGTWVLALTGLTFLVVRWCRREGMFGASRDRTRDV